MRRDAPCCASWAPCRESALVEPTQLRRGPAAVKPCARSRADPGAIEPLPPGRATMRPSPLGAHVLKLRITQPGKPDQVLEGRVKEPEGTLGRLRAELASARGADR